MIGKPNKERLVKPSTALALLLAIALVGCSGSATTPAPTTDAESPSGAPTGPAATEDLAGVTLTVWDSTQGSPAKQEVDALFTQQTGIELDYQMFPDPYENTVLAKWGAGDRPDIFWYHQGTGRVQLNPVENLRDLTGEAFSANYIPSLAGVELQDGKRYGVMLDPPAVRGLIYNKLVLEDAGLEPPKTLAELRKFCADLRATSPDVAPLFVGGGDQWPLQLPFMLLVGDLTKSGFMDEVNAGTKTFSDPAFVAVLDEVLALFQSECVNEDIVTATWEGAKEALVTGKAALDTTGPATMQQIADAYGGMEVIQDTLAFAPMGFSQPTAPFDSAGALGNFYLPITGDAKREAAALEYARFFTSVEGYQTYLDAKPNFPVFQGFEIPSSVTEAQAAAQTAANENGFPNLDTALAVPYGDLGSLLAELLVGTKTAQEVADEMTNEFERNAESLGLPGF